MLSKEEVKSIISDVVVQCQGCKGTELPVRIAEYAERNGSDAGEILSHDIILYLSELVKNGEVCEIEYEVPSQSGRTKSFILPYGSVVVFDLKGLESKA